MSKPIVRFMSSATPAARQRCAVIRNLDSIARVQKLRDALNLRRNTVASLDDITSARLTLAVKYLNRTVGL